MMMNLIEKVEAFAKQHGLSNEAAEQLKHLLDEASEDRIALVWQVCDVRDVRPDLDTAQCREVLAVVLANHDANWGVTWDTLWNAACDLFPLDELCRKIGEAVRKVQKARVQ